MDISELVKQGDGQITGWVTFVEGFDVELEYVDKKKLFDIKTRCTKTVYRNHQPIEDLDEKRMMREIAGFIRDWKGMDGKMVRRFFPVKEGVDLTGVEVPCTLENKLYMLENAYGFDDFIMKNITRIEAIQAERFEEELKNSGALSRED